MIVFLRKYQLLCLIVFLINSIAISAQSYKKDSLQIKSYTLIEYRQNEVKDVKLIKVLCDYCTDFQKEAIGVEAMRRAKLESYDPVNKMKEGDKKLAIYIRIAKKDFAAIIEED
ncbi:hypothetical protein [Psychroserpens damuponensis]|uniref:hypothetical protein n=1 Tax=Psychroserpens damuponensis TaxID=943936 RepID=UPI000AF5E18E|nr:hypothetical protein [Psychroserpens damuponensis]